MRVLLGQVIAPDSAREKRFQKLPVQPALDDFALNGESAHFSPWK
jgi:hypothetical protein